MPPITANGTNAHIQYDIYFLSPLFLSLTNPAPIKKSAAMQYKASVGRHNTARLKKTAAHTSLPRFMFPSPITLELIRKYAPAVTHANPPFWAIS